MSGRGRAELGRRRSGAGVRLAVLGLLGWSTVAGTAGPVAACAREAFAVALDVGHERARPGAISARGVPEFEFNLSLARVVLAAMRTAGFERAILVGEIGSPLLRRLTARGLPSSSTSHLSATLASTTSAIGCHDVRGSDPPPACGHRAA